MPALFEDLVPDIDKIMGVKAVFGPLRSRVMCFAGRGDKAAEPKKWYQAARSTAERAMQRRWLIAIAGGRGVRDGLDGRVLNLVSVSSTYGEMTAFVRDEAERERLAQWPTAVALRDVYDVDDYPHVVGDLGLDDLRVLENAFDGVVRPEDRLMQLHRALRGREVRLRDLPPLIGFHDEDRLVLTGSLLPGKVTAEEGNRLKREATLLERDPSLAREAKERNRARNGGRLVCEGCDFADGDERLYDAHHLVPLAVGTRQSVVSDLAVLCPTCHRIIHSGGRTPAYPMPIEDLRRWWAGKGVGPRLPT